MGTAHQARPSDRSSPGRLRRHLSRRRLHHRAEGDLENLGSSRRKKNATRTATRALCTDFRPRHFVRIHRHENGRSVFSHPSPRRETLLNRLALFARVLLPSPGLNRTAQSHPSGEISCGPGPDTYQFPILWGDGTRRPRIAPTPAGERGLSRIWNSSPTAPSWCRNTRAPTVKARAPTPSLVKTSESTSRHGRAEKAASTNPT